MKRSSPGGLTLLELVAATGLLTTFLLLVYQLIAQQTRVARDVNLGAGELLLALRAAEQFRQDARNARSATLVDQGRGVELKLEDRNVSYAVNAQGRLERSVGGVRDLSGPRVQSLTFALAGTPTGAGVLLQARWLCAADQDTDRPDLPRGAGRLLVLDTMLRAEWLP